MRFLGLMFTFAALVAVIAAPPAAAQILYTRINVSIPLGGSYDIDLNRDGVVDFTLRSKLLQSYCQSGDEYIWSATVSPAQADGVVVSPGNVWSDEAAPLPAGAAVGSAQRFDFNYSVLAGLYWGMCDAGVDGQWLNLPARYLGLRFQGPDHEIHYGWLKVSTAAYVDTTGIFTPASLSPALLTKPRRESRSWPGR